MSNGFEAVLFHYSGREVPGDVDANGDANSPVSSVPRTLEESRRAVNQLKAGKLLKGATSTLTCSCRGEPPPSVVAHSVVFHLEHGYHPDGLETGRCLSDLEGKG